MAAGVTLDPLDRPAGAVLEARHVSLSGPGGVRILDDINLDVQPGDRLAVIGPNGAGKTSLLRVLSGRITPGAGAVAFMGAPLARMKLAERARHTAFVAQHEQPDPRLTVIDYVGLGRVPHSAAAPAAHRAAIDDALLRTGLVAMTRRRLGTLSGGERQRAMIARAIAQQPILLLLDEPTNHLDLQARAAILHLVRDLGCAVVAVLHDLALVAGFADRVAVLQAGRLVVHAPVAAAFDPAIIRDVFGLDIVQLRNPATGRMHQIFDQPG
jgi:iron complex transport system ATP-binding protein